MGIEFATMGTILFLIRLFLYGLIFFFGYKLIVAILDGSNYNKYLFLWMIPMFIMIFIPSSITPKLTLEPNLPRVEQAPSEIIIEKPKDRVEYLPGFVPMGEKSE